MGFMIKAIHPKSFTTTQHFQDENGKVVGWDWCKNRPSSGGPKESGIVWPKWVGKARNLLRLGGGFKDFLFSPRKLGKSPNLTHIFQRGWNHQLVKKSKQWLNKTWFQVTGSCKIFWFLVKFWAFVHVTWVGTELILPNLEVPMDFCLAQRWTRKSMEQQCLDSFAISRGPFKSFSLRLSEWKQWRAHYWTEIPTSNAHDLCS